MADSMDSLGHTLYKPHMTQELIRKRDFHVKRKAEKEEAGEEYSFDITLFLTEGMTCNNCNGYVSFQWSGVDGEAPVVHHQSAPRTPTDRQIRAIADDTRCPVPEILPEILPVTLKFTCRSGRVALGNDFREATKIDTRKNDEVFISINTDAGKADYIKWYGSHGYCTGRVYGHVWFLKTDDGLKVRCSNESSISEEEWEQLDDGSVHDYSAELWWFAIIDAEDLPEGATDSYDREPGFMDLEPGEYEFTSYLEADDDIIGTLKRIEGSNDDESA